MIRYTDRLDGLEPADLHGFFEGWPNPPSPERHLDVLRGSDEAVLAIDEETGRVVGFATAISDGVLAAYVPLLEVLPAYRGRGIGHALMERLIARLDGFYMVDLVSAPGREPFYERLGFRRASAMVRRDFGVQSGRPPASQRRPADEAKR